MFPYTFTSAMIYYPQNIYRSICETSILVLRKPLLTYWFAICFIDRTHKSMAGSVRYAHQHLVRHYSSKPHKPGRFAQVWKVLVFFNVDFNINILIKVDGFIYIYIYIDLYSELARNTCFPMLRNEKKGSMDRIPWSILYWFSVFQIDVKLLKVGCWTPVMEI